MVRPGSPAPGILDVDHVGPQVGHQRAGQGPGDHVGELHHFDPGQCGLFHFIGGHDGPPFTFFTGPLAAPNYDNYSNI